MDFYFWEDGRVTLSPFLLLKYNGNGQISIENQLSYKKQESERSINWMKRDNQ